MILSFRTKKQEEVSSPSFELSEQGGRRLEKIVDDLEDGKASFSDWERERERRVKLT